MLNSNLNGEKMRCKNNINLSDYLLSNDEYGDDDEVEDNENQYGSDKNNENDLNIDMVTKSSLQHQQTLTVVPIDREAPSQDK